MMAHGMGLERLAALITKRNAADAKIARIIGRPAHSGHIGEFVAANIFNIELHGSASRKGSDGYFCDGELKGRSVNIKYYSKLQDIDIVLSSPPDYYLVLTGPKIPASTSVGTTAPWVVASVFLFEYDALVERLKCRGVKIGDATSVRQSDWHEAEIYPSQNCSDIQLTASQRRLIEMFGNTNPYVSGYRGYK